MQRDAPDWFSAALSRCLAKPNCQQLLLLLVARCRLHTLSVAAAAGTHWIKKPAACCSLQAAHGI
jgi:hypothetical protein